jgi:hypothetical protein
MPSTTIPIPKTYLEKILKPVSRLNESCVLKANGDDIFTICATDDHSVILYAKSKLPLSLPEPVQLNLINIKKFLHGLDCLGVDGEFSLKVGKNNVVGQLVDTSGRKTHFKYHLVDDVIIKKCNFQIDKLAKLEFDTIFQITSSQAKQILSAASFASEVSKVYFSVTDDVIQACVNDETLQNVDNITIPITSDWLHARLDGSFPISLEIFKNLAAIKNDITVKVNNQYKLIVFNVVEDTLDLKYIVSALIK